MKTTTTQITGASATTTTTKGAIGMVNETMKMKEVLAVAKEAGVKFMVGMTKKDLIQEIQAVHTEASAASETLVAEHKTEEVVTMTTQEALRKIELERNERMVAKMPVVGVVSADQNKRVRNADRVSLVSDITQRANRYLKNLGELKIHVVGFNWFLDGHNNFAPQGRKKNQYGLLQVQVEPGVLSFHVWDQAAKKFNWKDFSDFTVDARRLDIFRPMVAKDGWQGVLTLPIYHSEKMGGFFVMLPNAPMKDDGFRPVFKTMDYRWDGNGSSTNNERVNAALTAYLRTSQSQFIQANPMNRHGWNESCMNCAHMQWLGVRDGVSDDIEMRDKKSSTILNALTTDESRTGSFIPQAFCTVNRVLVDEETVEELNAAISIESQSIQVTEEVELENGEIDVVVNYRYPSKNEAVIGGVIKKIAGIRAEGTKSLCEGCPFYQKTERKSDSRIASEIISERERVGNVRAEVGVEIFVSKYHAERVQADRQVVQTLAKNEWVTAFPGDVKGAEDFRIKGLGGITVYSSPAMKEALGGLGTLEYMGETEAYDTVRAEFEMKISAIYEAARNFDTLTQEKANEVFALALAKPEGLLEYQSSRWDRAVEWLRQSVIWAQERTTYRNRPLFTGHFSAQFEKDAREVDAADFITATHYREIMGSLGYGLGYRDLGDQEFVRYLDETIALDYVFHVVETGEKFFVTEAPKEEEVRGRTDAELVAGALQHMLHTQVSGLLYGVRTSEEPLEALNALKVCGEVKAYIAKVLDLKI